MRTDVSESNHARTHTVRRRRLPSGLPCLSSCALHITAVSISFLPRCFKRHHLQPANLQLHSRYIIYILLLCVCFFLLFGCSVSSGGERRQRREHPRAARVCNETSSVTFNSDYSQCVGIYTWSCELVGRSHMSNIHSFRLLLLCACEREFIYFIRS